MSATTERTQARGRRLLDRLVLLAPGMNLPTPDAADLRDQLRDRVAASIRDLVDQGGAVLLGRAGAVVLARTSGSLPRASRRPGRAACADGPANYEGIDDETARDRLTETDSARSRFVQRLYGRDPPNRRSTTSSSTRPCSSQADCVELLATAAVAFWQYGS